MKYSTRNPVFVIIVLLVLNWVPAFAQLQFESFLFEGYNSPFLDNASAVTLSPDETQLYISSFDDDAISLFNRDINNGETDFVESYKNGIQNVSGLDGVSDLLVSPDGRHLYATGQEEDAIAVFERDQLNGKLLFLYSAKNSNNGFTEYSGLNGVHKLKFTTDGNYLFAISSLSNTLTVFKRNVVTGYLTIYQQFKDGEGGINDMTYPIDLTISPDEDNVYVISLGDNAITTFRRETALGNLSLESVTNQIPGLNIAKSITVSPKNCYLFASDENEIFAFQRDQNTGALQYLETYKDNIFSNTIAAISEMRISKDGRYLLTASTQDDAISIFEINENNGVLSPVTALVNGVDGTNGLDYPVAFTKVTSSNQLYVASFGSNAMVNINFEESTGLLTFNNSANTASFGGLNGMGGSRNICISPDGLHAYIAGELDDALTMFTRNAQTGALSHLGTIEDGSANDGINGINTIISSPDGTYIYASGYWDHSVAIFQRDLNTGELTYLDRVKDNFFGADGLSGVRDIVMTTNGNYFYTAGYLDNGIGVYERDEQSGLLNYQSVVKDGVLGVDGLSNVIDLALSPDDQFLYAAAEGEAAISIYERDANGDLSYLNVIKNTDPGIVGLEGISAIEISEDGLHLYITSAFDQAIVHFARDANNGSLSFLEVIDNLFSENGVAVLDGASDLKLSADGQYLFVTAEGTGVLSAFSRDLTNGQLTLMATAENGDEETNGLAGANSVALSPDGKFIYVNGAIDDALAIFSCVVRKEIAVIICEGDSYEFGNEFLMTSGVYEQSVASAGCITITTLRLEVDPMNVEITKNICQGDAFKVADVLHTVSGEYSYSLLSSNGCDSVVNLTLEVLDQFPETLEAITICDGEVYNWNGMNYETSGQYEALLTTTYGCDSIVLLNLEVLPAIEESQSVTACGAEFYVFGTSNYISSGEYSHTFSSTSGCDSTVLLNLFFVPDAYTQEATICEGDVFELGDQILDVAGEYEGEVLLNNGCLVDVYLMLTVAPVAMSNTTVAICEGEEFLFNGVAYTESGYYSTAFPIGTECDSMAYLDLTVFPITREITATICEGEEYLFGNEFLSESGDYISSFDSYNGCDSVVNLLLNVVAMEEEINDSFCQGEVYSFGAENYTEGGTYMQTLLDSSGCETIYTLYLEQLSVIFAAENIVADDGTGNGSISILETAGGTAPYQYEWSTGEMGLNTSNLISGTYGLTITDVNGCFSTFEYEVSNLTKVNSLNDMDFKAQLKPNLIEQGGEVNLEVQSEKARKVEIILVDLNGREQQLSNLSLNVGETNFTFEAPKEAGIYLLQLRSERRVKSLKLSIVN